MIKTINGHKLTPDQLSLDQLGSAKIGDGFILFKSRFVLSIV